MEKVFYILLIALVCHVVLFHLFKDDFLELFSVDIDVLQVLCIGIQLHFDGVVFGDTWLL